VNVGDLLTNTATSYPDRPAFVFDGEQRTYGEALRHTDGLCRGLAGLGVAPGDRVAILMRNCPEYVETMFAVWKLGAVAVPLNATFTSSEVRWHLDDSGACVVVVDAEGLDVVATVRADLGGLRHVVHHGPDPTGRADQLLSDLVTRGGPGPFRAADTAPDDLAWLAYTSGTTGRPKGAMISHGALVFQALSALADCTRLETEHVGMHAAPLSHGSGYNAVVFTMKGCTQVIHQRSGFDVELFLDQVETYRVASLFLVPTQIKLVVDHPGVAGRDLSSLQWIMYGGAPMYRENQKKALETLGPVLVQIFGQTESPMTGTVLRREEHSLSDDDECALSVGRVRHGLQMRIVDEAGAEVEPGEAGEICLQGPTLMTGYWRRPDASAETLRDGWLHTGDVGRVNDRGFLFILDRAKDMIISGGLNVYPHEIEDVLLGHAGVDEVCVIGVPHEKWGEAVHAVVVPHPGAAPSVEELIAFAGTYLAPYKKPKGFDFVDALPKTAYGKVAKREVRARYWAHLDRVV
jgi:long-chain acyl-CoA synthetase